MSSKRFPNKSGFFKLFKFTRKNSNHQATERAPPEQTLSEDIKKADGREIDGKKWDKRIDN